MTFQERYQKLNDQQRHAVDTTEGPVMVVAGPGSGKTELLGMRVANILQKHDVFGSDILCLTFTDSAAKNMRERLTSLIGAESYKVNIHTFHSFAIYIIHQFHEDFYDGQQMKPADEIIQIDVLTEILSSLPLSDALSKKQLDGTFVYLSSVKDKIGKLKRAGLSPQEYEQVIVHNKSIYEQIEKIIIPVFENRLSKKLFADIEKTIVALEEVTVDQTITIAGFDVLSYQSLVQKSLLRAYESAQELDSTKPLSEWKKEWLKKDSETKELHLKDYYHIERNTTLVRVYEEYQKLMRAQGYIDFHDMILDVLKILQNKPGVLESLQERYQFILVDEFQDTNEAQMRMITLLTDHPVYEGRPNIMVVGDDDQAIYKFQGAEINNILQFKKRYPATEVITMTRNYRSTDFIVDFAQQIIEQGDDRLVNRIQDLEKKLEAANPHIPEGTIVTHSFDTQIHEYSFVVQEIQRLVKQGKSYSEIGIIARNHKQLERIAQHLQHAQVPIQYDKQRNILDEPVIIQLIQLIRLIISISENHIYADQSLLVEVLQYPFWQIERKTIWELAIQVQNARNNESSMYKRWLDLMLQSKNQSVVDIAQWLLDISSKASTHNYRVLLDEIIGNSETERSNSKTYTSPFRSYYFTQTLYQQNPSRYIQLLSALSTLIHTVRNRAQDGVFETIEIVVDTIKLYEQHSLALTDSSPYTSGSDAIQLLTAHKSKGLEFDTVFVLSCQKDIWLKSQGRSMINFPKNLPIESSTENWDDYLRLFFVALTRAKSHLYITNFQKSESGKDVLRLPFLDGVAEQNLPQDLVRGHKDVDVQNVIAQLESEIFVGNVILDTEEKSILQQLVDSYVLSVTHLNNFLDVTRGGPQQFLERNLLLFPQAKTPVMSYGTAMHGTIEQIYMVLKREGQLPSKDDVAQIYEQQLKSEGLNEQEYQKYLQRGQEVLECYVTPERFSTDHLIETNFAYQNVFINDVQIKGKIDKMILNTQEKTVEVFDLKTGKYQTTWKAYDDNKKIQLHAYQRQLIFYKLLVEGSRDYNTYQVQKGALEFLYLTPQNEILSLEYEITAEDIDRLKILIQAVAQKIKQLDFPDISQYPASYEGILQFEEDLIQEFTRLA